MLGLTLTAAAFAFLARLPADSAYAVDLLPSLIAMGLGFGLASPALTTLAMRGVGPQDAGLASGLVNTTQQIGAALGLAVLATLATSRTDHLTTLGHAPAEALTGGYRLAFGVAAGFVLAAIALAALPQRDEAGAAPSPGPTTTGDVTAA